VDLYRRHGRALLAYRDGDHGIYQGDAMVIRGADATHAVPDLGWGAKLGGRLLVVETPGDHRSVLSKRHVGALGDRIVAAMGEGMESASMRFAITGS
jgi:thioesterase domain-containing protein